MTWSIVAFDPPTGAFGVAVATRALAVGASCPFVRSGVGAVATQSMTNRALGPAVLDALANGCTPSEAIAKALEPDGGRSIRQLHAIDKFGRQPSFVVTTPGCLALRRAMLSERHTGTTLRHLEFPPHMFDNGAAAGGA